MFTAELLSKHHLKERHVCSFIILSWDYQITSQLPLSYVYQPLIDFINYYPEIDFLSFCVYVVVHAIE